MSPRLSDLRNGYLSETNTDNQIARHGKSGIDAGITRRPTTDGQPRTITEDKSAVGGAHDKQEILHGIYQLWSDFSPFNRGQLQALPPHMLDEYRTELREWFESEDSATSHWPMVKLQEYAQRHGESPEACMEQAKSIIDQMAYHHNTGDEDSLKRDLTELSETFQRARFIDRPVDIRQVPEDEDEWAMLGLDDPRQVPKIDLQWLYDEAPERIRSVIELLHVIGGRDQVMAPVLVLFVMNLAANLLGKELVGMNRGRAYYGNTAFVALINSGANKFFPDTTRKPLEAVLRQLMRGQPDMDPALDELQRQRQELRRLHGLAAGRTTNLLTAGGNVNGVYKSIGATIPSATLAKMTTIERAERIEQLKDGMRLDPGALILADEVTMTLQKLIGAGGSGVIDMGEVLKLFDSGVIFDKAIGVHGWQAVDDACVGLLGCSQPTTWNQTIGEIVDADTAGLLGRVQVLNMKDCLPVKIKRRQLTPNEAEGMLEDVLFELVNFVTHGKSDDGKIVCEFGDGLEGDWAGRLYAEVMNEMGPRYQELVNRYGFEAEAGCKGKVYWHAIKLCMTHKYYSLTPREVAGIRSSGSDRVPMPEDLDAQGQLVHERRHRQYVTDQLRDPDLFKKYVGLIITMMEANLMNMGVDVEASKLQKKIMRFIGELGKEATASKLREKSLRVKVGNATRRMTVKEIQQELHTMMELGLIGQTINSKKDIVYYLIEAGEEALRQFIV